MRNFHRDFETLNDVYNQQIYTHTNNMLTESNVTDDISNMHRDSSRRQLREALRKLAQAHHEDMSTLKMEDVYQEMKMFAEENLPKPVNVTVPTGPHSPIHNPSPMGISTEGTDGKTDDLTEREKLKLSADAAKKGKGPTNDKSSDEDDDEETIGPRGVEESISGNAQTALKDDEDSEHYERTGEIRKKKKTEADADEKSSVGENFDNMLDILKLTDQHHPMNNQVVEEEMYDCIRDYMETDGMSYAEAKAECSGRGYEESTETDDHKNMKKFSEAGPTGGGGADLQKSDDAFKIGFNQAMNVTDKQNSKKFGTGWMSNPGVKKVTKGMNNYMDALSTKLTKMATQLKN